MSRYRNVWKLAPIIFILGVLLVPSFVFMRHTKADPPDSSNWIPVFQDDFLGDTLDTSKWTTCWFWANQDDQGCTNGGNPQISYALPRNVSVSDGYLHLRTVKEDYTPPGSSTTYHWTSGMVTTDRIGDSGSSKFAFTYGYMEARARLATGNGVYNAFWTGAEDHSWPPEIDTFEITGDRPNVDQVTYHWRDGGTPNAQSQDYIGPNFPGEWHTYGVDWQPGLLIWYVDGQEVARSMNPSGVPSKNMHMLLSTEIWQQSGLTNGPDDTTPATSELDVDYVKVWQRQGNPSTLPSESSTPSSALHIGAASNGSSTYDKVTDGDLRKPE